MTLSVRTKATKTVRAATLLAVAGLLAIPGVAKAQEETWSKTGFIPIPGMASFDISWVDYTNETYYLADRTNKEIDSSVIATPPGTGAFRAFPANFVGAVLGPTGAVNNDQSGPNGVLTIPAAESGSGATEIWAGDGPQLNQGCPGFLSGKCSTVKVINASTGQLTHVIPTGGASRADELCHDPTDHLILMANDAEADFSFGTPFISFISTTTYKIVAGMQIPQTTNGIEQCNYDSQTGLFFLNLPEVGGPGNDTADGQVLVITPPTGGNAPKVIATYIIPTADCAGPQGQALGPDPQLLLGCNAVGPGGVRNSLIINKHTGAVIAIGWGIGGADQSWSNDTHYFVTGSSCTAATCLSGTSSQFAIVDHTPTLDQVVTISPLGGVSSHSIAADLSTQSGQAFLPVAGGVAIFTSSALDADDPSTPPQAQ
jgi:hypothetical protein